MSLAFALAMLLLAVTVIPASILYVRQTGAPNAFMYSGACIGVCAFQLACAFLVPNANRFDPVLLASVVHLLGGVGLGLFGLHQLERRRLRTTQLVRRLARRSQQARAARSAAGRPATAPAD